MLFRFRRRLSEASRPKLASLVALVSSKVNLLEKHGARQTTEDDLIEQQSLTIDHDEKGEQPSSTVDVDVQENKEQDVDVSDADEQGADASDADESDAGQQSIAEEKEQSDAESSSSESHELTELDKKMLAQIYVDPMIAKLRKTDVIISIPTPLSLPRFLFWMCRVGGPST